MKKSNSSNMKVISLSYWDEIWYRVRPLLGLQFPPSVDPLRPHIWPHGVIIFQIWMSDCEESGWGFETGQKAKDRAIQGLSIANKHRLGVLKTSLKNEVILGLWKFLAVFTEFEIRTGVILIRLHSKIAIFINFDDFNNNRT